MWGPKPILGITLPLWFGIGGMILGFVLMLISRPYFREYFSRKRETAPPGILEEPPPASRIQELHQLKVVDSGRIRRIHERIERAGIRARADEPKSSLRLSGTASAEASGPQHADALPSRRDRAARARSRG